MFRCMQNKDNKIFEITITTNGGVPYKWEYEIADEAIVEYVKDDTLAREENVAGGIADVKFVFKTLKKGATTIKLKYVSLIDNSIEKEERYVIKVDKYLTARLIKEEF
ncbi:MAG: protease inhibitor I42 family protein [Bacilli bacterium]|nr:protease inhibitor I42 family protein [Bacilli bacterium]